MITVITNSFPEVYFCTLHTHRCQWYFNREVYSWCNEILFLRFSPLFPAQNMSAFTRWRALSGGPLAQTFRHTLTITITCPNPATLPKPVVLFSPEEQQHSYFAPISTRRCCCARAAQTMNSFTPRPEQAQNGCTWPISHQNLRVKRHSLTPEHTSTLL